MSGSSTVFARSFFVLGGYRSLSDSAFVPFAHTSVLFDCVILDALMVEGWLNSSKVPRSLHDVLGDVRIDVPALFILHGRRCSGLPGFLQLFELAPVFAFFSLDLFIVSFTLFLSGFCQFCQLRGRDVYRERHCAVGFWKTCENKELCNSRHCAVNAV